MPTGQDGDEMSNCMSNDVMSAVRYKRGPKFKQGLLQAAPSLGPMQKFHVDLTGPHPRSRKGNVYLLTGICNFTKYLITVPLRDKTAMSVAKALVDKVYLIHGAG